MTTRLTPQQAAFAREYLVFGCASQAYRTAYKADGMSDASIHKEASRLLAHPKVAAEIAAEQERAKKQVRRSLDHSIEDQERAMELAEASGNASAYAAAALNKAKLLGYLTDRQEIKQTTITAPADAAPDIQALWKRSGLPELIGDESKSEPEVGKLKH